ncbi:MAG: hypothetical protein ABFD52_09555 [Acidobacteriota bacterium]
MGPSMGRTPIPILLALAAAVTALPPRASGQQAMCRETLDAWLRDRGLNARWNGGHTAVIMVRGGVEYICTCPDQNRPPVCRPAGSGGSGAAGPDAVSSGQIAERAIQNIVSGLIGGLFRSSAKDDAESEAAALRAREAALRDQEAERQKAVARWEAFEAGELKRLEKARRQGGEMLVPAGGANAPLVPFQPVAAASVRGKEPGSAADRARCAAYFSERARDLAARGKNDEAEFMTLQAQKAMSGEPLDEPCRAKASAGPAAGPVAATEVMDQYRNQVRALLDTSRKLIEVRRQKVDAEADLLEARTRIADLKQRAETASSPKDAREADALLKELEAVKGEAENRLKIASDNESGLLEEAKRAGDQARELESRLGPAGNGK